jgi:hypothetical protein
MTFDPKNLNIAVALIKMGRDKVALTWNDKWGAFVFPMTKIAAGPAAESAEDAALRAAAEVLQLPVRVVAGQTSRKMRTLQLSDSDGQIKDYHFTVVHIEVHPDFAAASISDRPVIFAPIDQLQAGEYQPISPSVKPILDELMA